MPLRITCQQYGGNDHYYNNNFTIKIDLKTGKVTVPGRVLYNGNGFYDDNEAYEWETVIGTNGSATIE